jgi:endoglucanase
MLRDGIYEETTNHKKLFLSELGVDANSGNGACAISSLLSYMNAHGDVWIGWTPWDLPPYNVTSGHTVDGAEMPWYAPFLTANFLP